MHRVHGAWVSCCETGETDCPCTCHPERELVHGCPSDGSGLTPCCGRTPFELPPTDRITSNPAAVTCPTTSSRHTPTEGA
jgi:hypothetical protein